MFEYQIFTYLPKNTNIKEIEFSLKQFCPRNNRYKCIKYDELIVDDSLEDVEDSLYIDRYYVKQQADALIYKIYHEKYKNDIEKEKMIDLLVRYIDIYIMKDPFYGNKRKDSILRFIKVLLSVNRDREIIDIVDKYYLNLNKRDYEFGALHEEICLDFIDLYQEAGDRALLIKNDYQLALKFYKLCTLDWKKFSKKELQKVDKYYKIWIDFMVGFFEGNIISISENHFLNNKNLKKVFESYNKALLDVNKSEKYKDSVQIFDTFINENSEYLRVIQKLIISELVCC